MFETWIVEPVPPENGGAFSEGVPTYRRWQNTDDMSVQLDYKKRR